MQPLPGRPGAARRHLCPPTRPAGGRGDFGKVKHRRNMVLPPHNLELERRQDAGIAVELRTCYANILPSLLSDSSHGHLHAAPPCIAMDVCPSLDQLD
ncbi:interferon epsilon isoform X2 [Pteropus vampyrus]|uniref:Interferon epsilon isoform X2 n=1 Tax=Pteropus vampyrus TaxID=132908 RepID=A0A6P6CX43_PTEVA|nr:interferon epsilon isoform X2 [Pteropus vampyrus]